MKGRVSEEMTEERMWVRRAPRAANLTGTVTKTRETLEAKATAKRKDRRETRKCYDCGEQGHIGVNCPYKWTNSIDEKAYQGSSWEREPEGEKAQELANLETPDDEGEWCWPRRNRINSESEWTKTSISRPCRS